MLRSTLLGGVVLGCVASAGQAAFFGTVDFDDGTPGVLNKEILVSNPQEYVIGAFGGPGLSLNYHGESGGSFKSEYLVVDSSGTDAGDIYGDVTVRALYRPSSDGFEFGLAVRVQELVPGGVFGGTGSSGWGIWATGGTQTGLGPGVHIAVELSNTGAGAIRATGTQWENGEDIVLSPTTWYDAILSVSGLTITATMTELDGSFNPVPGHTVTVVHEALPEEMPLTGMVGTRGAQMGGSAGYLLDNFQVVPEPAGLMLLGLGGLGLLRRRRSA